MRYGYACINKTLRSKNIFTSRTCKLAKFSNSDGEKHVLNLALQNVKDLNTILDWNIQNNFNFFRISSSILPWYKLVQKYYKNVDELVIPILEQLKLAGEKIINNNIRVSFHADPYIRLASKNPNVVSTSIENLEMLGWIFDVMGLDRSKFYKINLHVGLKYNPYDATLFIKHFKYLSNSVTSRLTLENDDSINMWNVSKLYNDICSKINVPIVYDHFHNTLAPDTLYSTFSDIYNNYIIPTWNNITPVIHYSSSKKIWENNFFKRTAHADGIWDFDYNFWKEFNVDVMFESKDKELSILRLKTNGVLQ
ncbi:MAG TPA: UV DNA damage repair endonuclease UvsE [Thermotogota bacterium]|nr:UV DNA damage repair endonuclease UvsE [Thermotogota bacterium]